MKQLLLVLLFFAGTLLADNTPKCQEFNTTQLKEYEGCLQKFAEQGDFSATKQLANFYYAGPQSYKNYKKAVEWYMKVEAQDAKSQYTIGQIYTFGGYGIEKDYKQAAYWYEKSMSNGNLGGMVTWLISMCRDGASNKIAKSRWSCIGRRQEKTSGRHKTLLGICILKASV